MGKKVIIAAFFGELALLALHLFKVDWINIDNTAILLVLLILLTPYWGKISKIKFGDFEAEIGKEEVKNIAQQAAKSGLDEDLPKYWLEKVGDEIKTLLSGESYALALVRLRIEMERNLKRLARSADLDDEKNYGITPLAKILNQRGEIDNELLSLIRNVSGIMNRSVHGEYIAKEDAESIVEVGIRILHQIDEIYVSKYLEPLTDEVIDSKTLRNFMDAKYEITTIIPLVTNPKKQKRILTQEQLDEYLEGYDEYAEFLVEIKKITKE